MLTSICDNQAISNETGMEMRVVIELCTTLMDKNSPASWLAALVIKPSPYFYVLYFLCAVSKLHLFRIDNFLLDFSCF